MHSLIHLEYSFLEFSVRCFSMKSTQEWTGKYWFLVLLLGVTRIRYVGYFVHPVNSSKPERSVLFLFCFLQSLSYTLLQMLTDKTDEPPVEVIHQLLSAAWIHGGSFSVRCWLDVFIHGWCCIVWLHGLGQTVTVNGALLSNVNVEIRKSCWLCPQTRFNSSAQCHMVTGAPASSGWKHSDATIRSAPGIGKYTWVVCLHTHLNRV